MQEVFEKIDAILQKYRKKWLEQPNTEPCKGLECISNDCVDCMLTHLENDINQVAEEYRTTMGQVKCDTSFSYGYIKAIDDAIEKFLEYGCFLVEWNPKLSKESLVTDVLRQVKGQAVYNLEKMKQKEIDSVNQVTEEYKSLLTDTDLVKALRCLGSQTADGDCYETLYNMQHMGDEDYKPMRCGACESETKICCPYHQKTYDVCFEDGDCWWLREVADMIELIAGTNVHSNAFNIIYNKVCKLEQQYAKVEGNMEAVNDCIRLENLLQYFKEELREGNNQSLTNNNQSLTNADKIRSMTDEELAEFLFKYSNCEYCCISEKCTKLSENSCIDTFLVWLQSEVEE
ncbi:MAG: hypothetical protein IKK59_05630 [Lachnospiraceae bacterium]|nr:hypothetical protein [Lachnospiraceae bacterium]